MNAIGTKFVFGFGDDGDDGDCVISVLVVIMII